MSARCAWRGMDSVRVAVVASSGAAGAMRTCVKGESVHFAHEVLCLSRRFSRGAMLELPTCFRAALRWTPYPPEETCGDRRMTDRDLKLPAVSGALSHVFANRLSISWGVRATLTRSFGLFLLSSVAVGIGTGLARIAWLNSQGAQRQREALEAVLFEKYEPRRNEENPALSAVLIGNLTRGQYHRTSPDFAEIFQVVEDQSRAFMRDYARDDCGSTDTSAGADSIDLLGRKLPNIGCTRTRDAAGEPVHLRIENSNESASVFLSSFGPSSDDADAGTANRQSRCQRIPRAYFFSRELPENQRSRQAQPAAAGAAQPAAAGAAQPAAAGAAGAARPVTAAAGAT
jgi:hypothetical protein